MRRVVQAAICVMIVWFGWFEVSGFAVFKGEAAIAPGTVYVQASAKSETVTYYETMQLFTAIEESDEQNRQKDKQIKENVQQSDKEPVSNEKKQQVDKQTIANENAQQEDHRNDANKKIKLEDKQSAASKKTVYLTFDDGPSKNTEQVLAILKEEGIKATFFVLGEHVKEQPELAKRIAEEGHSIGNHSFNHKYDKLYGSFAEFANQVTKTDELIFKTTGVRTTLFRAPGGTYGNFDQGYFDAMKAAGYQVHDWNVDSGDSKRLGVPGTEILETIKGSKLADKLVVLLHDSVTHEESVKVLPDIIRYYKNKGYSFAPITEETKPVQFTLASKLKWTRAKVTQAQAQKLTQFSEALGRSVQPKQVEKPEPALILHRGGENLELMPEEYGVTKGSIEVSLSKMMDFIGGTTELDLKNGVIEARKDGVHVIWVCSPAAKSGTVKEEQIAVPARATLQKFGIGITSFVYTDDQREIRLTE